jgi:hypothetical protein
MQRRELVRIAAAAALGPLAGSSASAQERPLGQGEAPAPSPQVRGLAAAPDTHRALAAVVRQFETMKRTRYQHTDVENARTGTLFYDCVGMVTYTLRLGTPAAHRALMQGMHIQEGYVPTPAEYVDWISMLSVQPDDNWQRIRRVENIHGGNVLVWTFEGHNPALHGGATGHAVIAAGPPLRLSDGSFALLVYDSTCPPHGPFDTRLTDPRNLPLQIRDSKNFGHPSGLGRGTLQVIPDPQTGGPAAIGWVVGARPNYVNIEIGHPIR